MNNFSETMLMRVPLALRVPILVGFCFSVLALLLPRLTSKAFRSVESLLARLAGRKTLTIVALFFTVIGARLAGLQRLPVPVPGIHDEFRNLSRKLVSNVFVEIPARTRSHSGPRAVAWRSLDRRPSECCCDVRRDSLDVAGLASGKVGISRRCPCRAEIWNRQLLDQQLLGRSRCGHGRCACAGCNAAYCTSLAHARCLAAGAGNRHPGKFPPLRGIAPFHPRRGLVPLVARGKNKAARHPANAHRLRFRTTRRCSAPDRRLHGLLQLAANRKRLSLPVCLEHADLSNDGTVPVGPPEGPAGISQPAI